MAALLAAVPQDTTPPRSPHAHTVTMRLGPAPPVRLKRSFQKLSLPCEDFLRESKLNLKPMSEFKSSCGGARRLATAYSMSAMSAFRQ